MSTRPLRRVAIVSGIAAALPLALAPHAPASEIPSPTPVTTAATTIAETAAVPGEVYTLGRDELGTLGDGYPRLDQRLPVPVPTTADRTTDVSCSEHCLALRIDGTVMAWGANPAQTLTEQAGARDTLWRPLVLNTLSGMAGVEARSSDSFAWDAQGTLLAWGTNQDGSLGLGDALPRRTPTPVPGLPPVAKAVGNQYGSTLALTQDGRVFAWGTEQSGAAPWIGPNAVAGQVIPVEVPLPGRAVDLAVGTSFGLAALEDGSVWAWGDNSGGQLGLPLETTESWLPVRIPLPEPVRHVGAVMQTGFAITGSGTAYSWGLGNLGGLATDGFFTPRPTPAVVAGLPPVAEITGGYEVVQARDVSGGLWVWGSNYMTRGDGRRHAPKTPVQVALPGTLLKADASLENAALVIGTPPPPPAAR